MIKQNEYFCLEKSLILQSQHRILLNISFETWNLLNNSSSDQPPDRSTDQNNNNNNNNSSSINSPNGDSYHLIVATSEEEAIIRKHWLWIEQKLLLNLTQHVDKQSEKVEIEDFFR